jgi:tetratricopeptide (TPR) repeat protein
MDFAGLEHKLIKLRRERDWDAVFELLDSLPDVGDDDRSGWVKWQTARSIYNLSGDHVWRALRLIDDAVPLLMSRPLDQLKSLLDGMVFARYAEDDVREGKYSRLLLNLVAESAPELSSWHGRVYSVLALASERAGNVLTAIHFNRKVLQFYKNNIGPFHDRDRRLQLCLSHTSLGNLAVRVRSVRTARRHFVFALRLVGTDDEAIANFNKGRIFALDGEMATALECFRATEQLCAGSKAHSLRAEAVYAISELHRAAGEWAELKTVAKTALAEAAKYRVLRYASRIRELMIPGGVWWCISGGNDWCCSYFWDCS